ncbi:MAG: hypothetical protein ACI8Y4_005282 [Candidatus Poriferisodalaceae bacterium]
MRTLINGNIVDGANAGDSTFRLAMRQPTQFSEPVLQSMRSMILGETSYREASSIANLLLRLLGVPASKVDQIIDRAISVSPEANLYELLHGGKQFWRRDVRISATLASLSGFNAARFVVGRDLCDTRLAQRVQRRRFGVGVGRACDGVVVA